MSAAIGAFVAQALSHTGSYAHDAGRKSIYLSDEAYRTFGFDPSIGTVTYEQVRSRVHPEDVNEIRGLQCGSDMPKEGLDIRLPPALARARSSIFTALVVPYSTLQVKFWKSSGSASAWGGGRPSIEMAA